MRLTSSWAWSDKAEKNPKFFKIINQEYIQKTDMINFPFYIGPHKNRRFYEITDIHPSFTASVDQFNIFCRIN